MKKEIYILIGPAAIGKTTYIQNAGFLENKLCIVSRDEVVGRVSERYKLEFDDLYHFPPHDSVVGTYVPGFEKYGKVIESPEIILHLHPFSYEYLNSVNAEINYRFYNEFQTAIRRDDISFIVIDRIHMRSNERKAYMSYLDFDRKNFIVTAVLFNFKDEDTLDIIEQISISRTKSLITEGKRPRTVSRKVQEKMIEFYEEPSYEEGFDSIITIDTLPNLRKYLKNV